MRLARLLISLVTESTAWRPLVEASFWVAELKAPRIRCSHLSGRHSHQKYNVTTFAKPPEDDLQERSDTADYRYVKQWIALVTIWIFVALALGYYLFVQRENIAHAERDRLSTQARVIEENLTRQVRGAVAALTGVRYDLTTGDRDPHQNLAPLRLKVLSDSMPGVRAIAVMNNFGTIVDADRKDLVGRNFREAPSFQVPAGDADPTKLYISPPFKSPISGVTISLAKVMQEPSGGFAGLVLATLDPEYFDVLMRSVFYAPDMAAGIVHGDGKIIVVVPPDPTLLAKDVSTPGTIFRQHRDSGELVNLYEGQGAAAKPLEDRMIAVRTMQPAELRMNKSLVISVSRLRSAVYAPWYSEVKVAAILASVTLVLSVCLLYYTQHRRKVLEAIHASVRNLHVESAKRFEFGLKGADLGLWDWELEADRLTINAREAVMLGVQSETNVHSAKAWQRLIHPDDWPAVRAKFKELVEGTSEAYKLEHRMLHQDGHPVWVLSQAMVMGRSPEGRATRILGTHLDVSMRRAAEDELSQTLKRLELALRCGSVGLMDWDLRSGGLVLNSLAREILGNEAGDELVHAKWQELRHPDDNERVEVAIRHLLSDPHYAYNLEYRVRHARGHYLWLHVRAEVVERAQDGSPTRVMVTYRNVSARVASEMKLRIANEQLEALSLTDALTGVGNRRRFDQTLALEWARAARNQQPIGLLMIDIDHFKLYNDHYGHQGGDECLRRVAHVLASCVQRANELLTRYGGEEFAVLLFVGDLEASFTLAQRCVDAVAQAAIPHAASPVAPHVTLSIGVSSLVPAPHGTAEELVARADEALYLAKKSGRARACTLPAGDVSRGAPANNGDDSN